MENTGFKFESRIFYFIDLQNEEDYIIRKSKCSRISKRKVHFTKRNV